VATLTIEIPEEKMKKLRQYAQANGLSPEEWVATNILEQLAAPQVEVRRRKLEALTQRLLEERAEVYKALAEGAP
jgi:hypothetical protein